MSGELEGRVAIVTGASRGIGRAIAVGLARIGADMVLTGRDRAALASTRAALANTGVRALEVVGDLNDPATPARIVEEAMKAFGRIDIVVGNAGSTRSGNFLDFTDADWDDGFGVKFFSHVRLAKAAWPELARRHGSWVTISGINARTPRAQFTIGASVNQAYMAFTKSLADLGLKDGVQVNTINPGFVDTDRFTRMLQVLAKQHDTDEAGARAIYTERHGEIAQPEEIAELVNFIVTKPGRYFHGAALDIDAGVTPGLV